MDYFSADSPPGPLAGEADMFVGRRGRLKRYLVCSMEGFFPVAVRTGDQSIAAIFRVGAPHVGIKGTLAVTRSDDGGKTWSDPVEIAPRWLDNRNPAFGVNANGELIAAYWRAGLHTYMRDGDRIEFESRDDEPARQRLKQVTATFFTRSGDGGRTWSEPQALASRFLSLASPYGRIIQAPDGTLLMCVYGKLRERVKGVEDACALLRSTDAGRTWGDETLAAMKYNETSFAFLPDGRLLAAARSQIGGHVAVLHSEDGGRSWSQPVQVTRDGEHPADLTVLSGGSVLLTFGRRIRPMGCGALISDDGGRTWNTDREVLLAGDGVENIDLGYPSTIQLADGTIVTLMYFGSGSAMADNTWAAWGKVSCQAIHYRQDDLR